MLIPVGITMGRISTIALLTLCVLFSQMAISQADSTQMNLSVSLAPSLTYFQITSDDFGVFQESQNIPHVGLGVELEYGPLLTILDLNLMPTLVIAYGRYEGTGVQIKHLPVFIGVRFESSGRLRPFVRLMAGVARSKLELIDHTLGYRNTSTSQWEACFDGGAGLECDISEKFGVAATFDQWTFPSNLLDEYGIGLTSLHAVYNYSVRLTYRFSNSD